MSDSVRLAVEAQEIFKAADAKGRPLSADERNYVEDLLERAKDAHNLETKMATSAGTSAVPDMPYAFQGGSFLQPGSFRNGPGDIFVNSAGYKHVRSPDGRPQTWTTGMVEVTPPRRVST